MKLYIYTMTSFASSPSATQMSQDRQIAYWLFTLAGFVVLMVLVGGLTRLTDSGLSITEWEPIRGAIPPLSDAAWQIAFEKYQQIPEFTLVNFAMTLAEFKVIYWWEWAHRFLGRIVGLVFLLPFLVFLAQGKLARHRILPLLGLFALGGLQGFMGWYMVSSGLSERVDVSQYRLAAHLGLALIIFGSSVWLALSYLRGAGGHMVTGARVAAGGLIVGLLFLQSLLGALVAGIDAGMTYNDWPFMDGEFVPTGLLSQQPMVRNFFENHLTVQFDHRLLAYILTAIVAWHIYWVLRTDVRVRVRQTALLLGAGVALQVVLGIVALMLVLPMSLAAAHQIGAVIVLGIAVTHLHFLRHN
ncbi:COX15/CtaA family protein [Alphaproteobacteria bacterium]|nr:COX15/CtaA family protein [Alphaproteobacteria bacterium]MDC0147712.1 COX15/CtaA family protein [Alphaproteobacteria bacterium]